MTGPATVQSIELLLDPAADAAVRACWQALADAGLPSLARHTGATNAPHLTVAVVQGRFAAAMPAAVANVVAGWDLARRGLAGELGGALLFGGPHRVVLARQVVPSRRLVTLHEAVHRAIAVAGDEPEAHTRVDAWTPHVTLASRLPTAALADALAVLDPAPIACRFVAARLWDSAARTVTPLGPA